MADRQMDELDRLAARSLAAQEAAERQQAQPRRSLLPWAIAGLLFSFVLGMIASPWFERQVRGSIPGALAAGQQVDADPRVDQLLARVAELEAAQARPLMAPVAPATGNAIAVAPRVAALEARVSSLQQTDSGVQSRIEGLAAELAAAGGEFAEGNARLRDLFLLSVARRMVDAGRPLQPLERALEARFRTRDAAALEALEAWSRAPQTRSTLGDRLAVLERQTVETTDTSAGWWDRLVASLSGLVQVKGEVGARAATPEMRVAEAGTALATGDLRLAAELVDPIGTAAARQWATDARLLLAADEALGRLDALAIEAAMADASILAAPSDPAPSAGSPLNAPPAP